MRIPKPHQLLGAEYGFRNNGACYWMKMRTGKTLTTILALEKLESFPALIVCPRSIMQVWKDEIVLHGCDPNLVRCIDGTKQQRESIIRKQQKDPLPFCIINYEAIEPFRIFHSYPWQAIVLDESLKVANITAKRTQYILEYVQSRRYPEGQARFCLSGSPASEGPVQLIPQMYFVHGNFMGNESWDSYMMQNWRYDDRYYKWVPIQGKKHTAEIQEWNKEKAFHCDLGIGDKILRRRVTIELSERQRDKITKIRQDAFYQTPEGESMQYTPLVRANHELQVCMGLDFTTKIMFDTRKIEAILDWHKDTGEPCLVLSQYRTGVLECFKKIAESRKIKYGVMVGGSAQENQKVKEMFDKGLINVVFGQITVVKMGLNFSRANTIHYLSNSYSQDDRTQSELRCSTMDKTDPVEVIDYITPGCLDGAVVDLLESKQSISSSYVQKWAEDFYAGNRCLR